nr:hypothetical protein Itr_chr14CG13360 [Ipomoea trifida]
MVGVGLARSLPNKFCKSDKGQNDCGYGDCSKNRTRGQVEHDGYGTGGGHVSGMTPSHNPDMGDINMSQADDNYESDGLILNKSVIQGKVSSVVRWLSSFSDMLVMDSGFSFSRSSRDMKRFGDQSEDELSSCHTSSPFSEISTYCRLPSASPTHIPA